MKLSIQSCYRASVKSFCQKAQKSSSRQENTASAVRIQCGTSVKETVDSTALHLSSCRTITESTTKVKTVNYTARPEKARKRVQLQHQSLSRLNNVYLSRHSRAQFQLFGTVGRLCVFSQHSVDSQMKFD